MIDTNVFRQEIETFYYMEAEALDNYEFDSWLKLLGNNIHYVVGPRANIVERRSHGDPAPSTPFIDDRLEGLKARIARLADSTAWAESPRSRTRRLVTNVLVKTLGERNLAAVQSNFAIYRSRRSDKEDVFFGSRSDLIGYSDFPNLTIERRFVILDQSVLKAHNVSIIF